MSFFLFLRTRSHDFLTGNWHDNSIYLHSTEKKHTHGSSLRSKHFFCVVVLMWKVYSFMTLFGKILLFFLFRYRWDYLRGELKIRALNPSVSADRSYFLFKYNRVLSEADSWRSNQLLHSPLEERRSQKRQLNCSYRRKNKKAMDFFILPW